MSSSSTDPAPIRVLLADDHQSVRDAICFLLGTVGDIQIVAEAADGLDAVEQAAKHEPDLVLMDVSMPRLNGIEATRRIAQEHPRVQVLALVMDADQGGRDAMIKAGAAGSVDKAGGAEQLLGAIRRCAGAATYSRRS